MLSGSGSEISLWSTKSTKEVLKIQKKGDFKIREFAVQNGYIAYTDSVDTQIFKFDLDSLVLKKVSSLICQQNDLKRLPPAQKLVFDSSNKLVIVL